MRELKLLQSRAKEHTFREQYPTLMLNHTVVMIARAFGGDKSEPPKFEDTLPPWLQSEERLAAAAAKRKELAAYTPLLVESFKLGLKHNLISNGLFAALGLAELEASGWTDRPE